MSQSKAFAKKYGKTHEISKTQACQLCGEDDHEESTHDSKPDFDKKDTAIKPKRKSPEPMPKHRRSRLSAQSQSEVESEPLTPAANIQEES